jgi:hypothetical protein
MYIKKIAIDMAMGLTGRSYVLVMQQDQKFERIATAKDRYKERPDFSFHPRENQPCWGEMRKYEATHKGECTQPSNQKPGDLWHSFPEGKPVAFAANLFPYGNNGLAAGDNDKVLKFFFDEQKSPFRRGLKEVDFIEKDGHVQGVYLGNLDVDATVLVYLLRSGTIGSTNWLKYVQAGLTELEAFAFGKLMGSSDIKTGIPDIAHNVYGVASVSRMMNCNPRDLTGGLYSDRVDYNRTQIDYLWSSEDGSPSMKWNEEFFKVGLPKREIVRGQFVTHNTPLTEWVPLIKKALANILKAEGDVKNVPYIWTTTSGKTNGTKKVIAA